MRCRKLLGCIGNAIWRSTICSSCKALSSVVVACAVATGLPLERYGTISSQCAFSHGEPATSRLLSCCVCSGTAPHSHHAALLLLPLLLPLLPLLLLFLSLPCWQGTCADCHTRLQRHPASLQGLPHRLHLCRRPADSQAHLQCLQQQQDHAGNQQSPLQRCAAHSRRVASRKHISGQAVLIYIFQY